MRITLLLLFFYCVAWAQPPVMELQSYGFDPIEVSIPSISNDKLIKLTQSWAREYNFGKNTVDITELTDNSLTISSFKKNAFYYRNYGEVFYFRIHYTMKIEFSQNSYRLSFNVGDIYTDGNVLIEYKLPDYFDSSGKLKDGYSALDDSLEKTVNNIVQSHYDFIVNYR